MMECPNVGEKYSSCKCQKNRYEWSFEQALNYHFKAYRQEGMLLFISPDFSPQVFEFFLQAFVTSVKVVYPLHFGQAAFCDKPGKDKGSACPEISSHHLC